MEVRELTDQDHEVLGAEYCSGYTDVFGKWNTGFYCPNMGNGETVYCCGTLTYKYCCTRRDQQTSVGISQTVMLGSALGSVLVFMLVTLVSCLVCRRCVPYRRAHPSLGGGGPLYSLHCSSTASGVANMYSFSGQNTAATTPLDAAGDAMANPDRSPFTASLVGHHQRGMGNVGRGECGPRLPSDPPPPYSNDGPTHLLLEGTRPTTTTSFTTYPPSNRHQLPVEALPPQQISSSCNHHQHPPISDIISAQENLYWSTKF